MLWMRRQRWESENVLVMPSPPPSFREKRAASDYESPQDGIRRRGSHRKTTRDHVRSPRPQPYNDAALAVGSRCWSDLRPTKLPICRQRRICIYTAAVPTMCEYANSTADIYLFTRHIGGSIVSWTDWTANSTFWTAKAAARLEMNHGAASEKRAALSRGCGRQLTDGLLKPCRWPSTGSSTPIPQHENFCSHYQPTEAVCPPCHLASWSAPSPVKRGQQRTASRRESIWRFTQAIIKCAVSCGSTFICHAVGHFPKCKPHPCDFLFLNGRHTCVHLHSSSLHVLLDHNRPAWLYKTDGTKDNFSVPRRFSDWRGADWDAEENTSKILSAYELVNSRRQSRRFEATSILSQW